ncbi:MAG: 3-deoxy-D-manno-octulosonic acid transferase [Proteobacteria bacterium]|nr:3-deoxy-D-manno-octulosonic acid transferase [Pseudomonadota bacterium]
MGPLQHSVAALTAALAAPVGLAALAVRPRWRTGLRERLGSFPAVSGERLWLHAASVGEVRAVLPLIERLQDQGRAFVLTTTTLAGREVARAALPGVACALAPLDHPWCVERMLRRVRVAALVLVETEVWPQWVAAAGRHELPAIVVSGRLSDRSFPRYARWRRLLGGTWRRLAAVGARSERDAERFRALGVAPERVSVTGDLKLDPGRSPAEAAPELVRALAGHVVVVGASTHAPEEEVLLEAFAASDSRAATLVLAPRRLERAPELVRQAAERGLPVALRTALVGTRLDPGGVLVLDTFGELAALYRLACWTFVGGTLAPVGGHNVLEPIWGGSFVRYGPELANVRESARILEAVGGGRGVADAKELAEGLEAALREPEAQRERAEAALRALEPHRTSVSATLDLLAKVAPRVARGPA